MHYRTVFDVPFVFFQEFGCEKVSRTLGEVSQEVSPLLEDVEVGDKLWKITLGVVADICPLFLAY